MTCHAEHFTTSPHRCERLPELTYPFHDRDVLIASYARCLHGRLIKAATAPADQPLASKQADAGIGTRESRATIWHAQAGTEDMQPRDGKSPRAPPASPVTDVLGVKSSWRRGRDSNPR